MLRKLLMFLLLLFMALIIGSFFLPDRLLIERSATIAKPPASVFRLLNGFQYYTEWSPWHDPGIQYQLSGPEQGLGASLNWQSASRGDGMLEIVESEEARKISMRMEFADRGAAYIRFLLEPSASGTTLRWQYEVDLTEIENPFYHYAGRYMAILMGNWVGDDFDQGLEKIRKLALTQTP